MTAGVPQVSVLGPTLWNVAYDDVLRLEHTEGVHTIAYVDDLALLIAAKDMDDIEDRTNDASEELSAWMKDNALELAPEKSEAIVLLSRRKDRRLHIAGHPIEVKKAARYLGATLEKDLKAKEQIRRATMKASEAATNIAKILPRTRGASEGQRRILATVAESIALYGAPIWGPMALKTEYNQEAPERCQRIMGIRITRCYRTVSTKAIMVLARTIPWPLLIQQRTEMYQENKRRETPYESDEEDNGRKDEEITEETFQKWQSEWESTTRGRWTYASIPDVKKWSERKHGELSCYFTQVLTNHGNFKKYLHRMKRSESPVCTHDAPHEPGRTTLE